MSDGFELELMMLMEYLYIFCDAAALKVSKVIGYRSSEMCHTVSFKLKRAVRWLWW